MKLTPEEVVTISEEITKLSDHYKQLAKNNNIEWLSDYSRLLITLGEIAVRLEATRLNKDAIENGDDLMKATSSLVVAMSKMCLASDYFQQIKISVQITKLKDGKKE